jgi:hypothetical protein
MKRLIIEYDNSNKFAKDFVELMRKMKIFSVMTENELTKREIERVEASLKSKKINDVSKLMEKLKS